MCSLYDGHCLVEAFELGGFEFEVYERDMMWSLPVLCSFDSLKKDGSSEWIYLFFQFSLLKHEIVQFHLCFIKIGTQVFSVH